MSVAVRNRLVASALVATAFILSACVAVPAPTPGPGAPTIGPKAAFTMRSAPVKGAKASFALARLTGAPEDVVVTTTRTLQSQASARNLKFSATDDPSATYILKGYLSAVGDKQGTLLVYVWDVFDRNGTRLHRISGQEHGSGTTVDPWSGISSTTVSSAARDTIDDLVAWAGSG
ncbi:MAG: hypothetical protein J0H94_09865 [Rhizobiales bacterium]|jgi:hypothetical protein|nr:hypothetical protein [Hyphomicrobiales bacterium]